MDNRIRQAENRLFNELGLEVQEHYLDLPSTQLRLRVLVSGRGRLIVLLHGVAQSSAVWAPLLTELRGYQVLAVDLPGHGLSDPVDYTRGQVREHTLRLFDDLLGELGLETTVLVGHSLGGMYALWYAAARPNRVASLISLGDPAGAFPGVRIRMPLSILTIPRLGDLVLRIPYSRPAYRAMLVQGLGAVAAERAPDPLVDALRLAQRRPGNARTVARLMHALNGFCRPRPETVMSDAELRNVEAPALFIWGREDPYLSPRDAQQSIDKLSAGTLREVPGGHAPWLEDAAGCARLLVRHLAATGFAPTQEP